MNAFAFLSFFLSFFLSLSLPLSLSLSLSYREERKTKKGTMIFFLSFLLIPFFLLSLFSVIPSLLYREVADINLFIISVSACLNLGSYALSSGCVRAQTHRCANACACVQLHSEFIVATRRSSLAIAILGIPPFSIVPLLPFSHSPVCISHFIDHSHLFLFLFTPPFHHHHRRCLPLLSLLHHMPSRCQYLLSEFFAIPTSLETLGSPLSTPSSPF
ncbi:unnamed protein product [Acanthosepion pharaonis]|uniref:NADH dehydrogenase subunit 5 n=1 Tax=Acanthosepion pharaonis TaxID=158019 RepID=A0A812AV11_ACAPH|nr:unnamed protein product [Sepia pharaonis]